MATTTRVDTGPRHPRDLPPTGPPGLAPIALARWTWRQLTSMRTALILLFMLALAAVPGSAIPQEGVDPQATSIWQAQHPALTPIYTHLGLFAVFSSPWFGAIYILLVISLLGCIVPRSGVYLRALRARPPKPPRNLSRLPEHRELVVDADVATVLARVRRALRGYRVDVHEEPDGPAIAAEKGKLREAGNLLFHCAVLLVLLGFAVGSLFGYKGGVIVVAGDGFANSLPQYDDFQPGGLFTPSELAPFSFRVDNFKVKFIGSGPEAGMAHEFHALLTYRTSPTAPPRQQTISVNHPLYIDGAAVYLISHGYAPHITVRDQAGQVVFAGPVVFLPEDQTFRSFGVVKVPDAKPAQLGFQGEFYPTYGFTMATGPFSAFPDDKNPVISMLAYRGNLGVNNGVPQSVYALDLAGLKPIRTAAGKPLRVDLGLGQTRKLPHHLGSITFDGVSRFVKLQVNRSPADWVTLFGAALALLGLLGSLFIRPRRIWVRVRPAPADPDPDGGSGGRPDGPSAGTPEQSSDHPGATGTPARTVVEVAGLDRSSGGDLAAWVDRLAGEISQPTKESS